MTAAELLGLEVPGKRAELVKGVLVVREPAGYRHGEVAAELARRLANHVVAENLGRVLAAETGFKLASDPDTRTGARHRFHPHRAAPGTTAGRLCGACP